jgi:putative nucleotidyltransferase with HDIG domain
MARQLGHQFRTLEASAEFDRVILSTLEEQGIVQTALEKIPELFACDSITVSVIDPHATGTAVVYTRLPDRQREDPPLRTVSLSPEEIRRIHERGTAPVEVAAGGTPSFVDEGIRWVSSCVAFVNERPGAVVSLGYLIEPPAADDLDAIQGIVDRVAVALSNHQLVRELERLNWQTLTTLARAIDASSPWTAGHSTRVTEMTLKIAVEMGLPDEELDTLRHGGLLHDVGKIGVPQSILDKPGRLTAGETEAMQQHPVIGAKILEPLSSYASAIPIVLYHHERYDGDGYPEGLVGEAIPRHARILSVADVFDALTSDRPYRDGWDRARVIEHIAALAGSALDPESVEAFLRVVERDRLAVESAEEEEVCS